MNNNNIVDLIKNLAQEKELCITDTNITEEKGEARDWSNLLIYDYSAFFLDWSFGALQEYKDLLTVFYLIGSTCKKARELYKKHVEHNLLIGLVCHLRYLQHQKIYGDDHDVFVKHKIFLRLPKYIDLFEKIQRYAKFFLSVVKNNRHRPTSKSFPELWNIYIPNDDMSDLEIFYKNTTCGKTEIESFSKRDIIVNRYGYWNWSFTWLPWSVVATRGKPTIQWFRNDLVEKMTVFINIKSEGSLTTSLSQSRFKLRHHTHSGTTSKFRTVFRK